MRSKYDRRKKLYEKIAGYCEVRQEVVSAVPVLTFCGNREIEIDGCSGILEYSPTRITLALGGDKFTVIGNCLTLSDFRYKVLFVRGEIRAAVFGEVPRQEVEEC